MLYVAMLFITKIKPKIIFNRTIQKIKIIIVFFWVLLVQEYKNIIIQIILI